MVHNVVLTAVDHWNVGIRVSLAVTKTEELAREQWIGVQATS